MRTTDSERPWALRAGNLLAQTLLEGPVVAQAGERVGVGLMHQPRRASAWLTPVPTLRARCSRRASGVDASSPSRSATARQPQMRPAHRHGDDHRRGDAFAAHGAPHLVVGGYLGGLRRAARPVRRT